MAEDDSKSEEDCEIEFNQEAKNLEQTIIAVDDSIHGTTTSEDFALFAGVLVDLITYIMAFYGAFLKHYYSINGSRFSC